MGEWYKDWFASKEYLTVYRHRDNKDAETFANTFLGKYPVAEGAEVLDAACGPGRFSFVFANKGYSVSGFDLSATLLEVAKNNAGSLNLNVNFKRSDIREVNYSQKFSLILNMFTSFGYFEEDSENFAFIKNSTDFIKQNGIFVLDYLNKSNLEKTLVPQSEKTVGNIKINEFREISAGRVNKKILLQNNDETSEYHESVKLYTPGEIENGFKDAGYKLLEIWGDYNAGKFVDDSPRCLMIFQK